jgi:geranylgeranyl pyrophosphate synthase
LTEKSAAGTKLDPLFGELMAIMTNFLQRGGKRLRPRLAFLAYQAFGGTDMSAFTQIAASQELFHAFLLMHDDIIDKDVVRWGGPNISGYYRQSLHGRLSPEDVNHFADSSALMAGDLCHGFAQEMILTSRFSPTTTVAMATLLQQTLFETMAGELVDVYLPYEEWSAVDLPRIMAVCVHKSARYSFMTPLQLGALCAGASTAQLKLLKDFGSDLGTAFQLRDDMLGMYGDEKVLGKPVLSDMQEGKKTLLVYHGFRMANAAQRKQLTRLLGNVNAGYADLKTLQDILTSTGAAAKTEATIAASIAQARSSYLKLVTLMASNQSAVQPLASEALNQLGAMIDSVGSRVA